MRPALLALLLLVAPASALAANPIDESTPHGVMMLQALHTLGADEVACPAAATQLVPAGSQVTCAQVPGSMYGFFREAVHGRLYEYLARKTLAVATDWSTAGDVLRVRYSVDGGTLTVARLRANGLLYAVFSFVGPSQATAPIGGLRAAAPNSANPPSANAP